MLQRIQLLPDWIYHAIEESYTCQFTSVTERGIPVALPVILNQFDPDTGTLVISSPITMKRVENVRRRPEVALLFSPAGIGKNEPPHVVLVQGRAEVDDADPENGWRRYFAGWARRNPPSRQNLAKMRQVMPGYVQRAIIRVRPARFLGWEDGDLRRAPDLVEVNP
jgi:general stress protein 26